MAGIDDILKEFPEPVREPVEQVWQGLSPERRQELEDLVDELPKALKPLKRILFFVLDQYKPVFGAKRSVAIVGPANVGKSTLYNQLISKPEDEAQVGPVPGTTRQNQEADTGLFILIDTPGADAVGAVGEREREIALRAAQRADFLVIVFEATRGVKLYEKDLFERLVALEKPFVVLLNKIDLVPRRDRGQVLGAAAHNLNLKPSQVIETVATKGTNVGHIILAIAKFEPELLAAIAQVMPQYRARLAWQRIVPAATGAGITGLIPLPFADLLPLLGIQSGLVLSIARIYGFEITPSSAKELMATFGVGFGARTLFQELSKFGGVPGWILSASIAAATTVTIGYASMLWFAHGERPTRQAMDKLLTDVTDYLKERLAGMGEDKPDRVSLRERMSQALADLPSVLDPRSVDLGKDTLGSEQD